jgi:hypothetical protein
MPLTDFPFYNTLINRSDLFSNYGNNAILLFALQMHYDIEDIDSIADDSLIDGGDDKKIDLLWVDEDSKRAIVAQAYFSSTEKPIAPDKASDLNTAMAWALSVDLSLVPERIKPAVIKLRSAIETQSVDVIEIWYTHNCHESNTVKTNLEAVQSTSLALLRSLPAASEVQIKTLEIGIETLDQWYKSTQTPILVTDTFEIEIPGGYSIQGEDWQGFSTAIKANWLYDRYHFYGTNLFSGNVRDYLGSSRRKGNINKGIQNSALTEPLNFWAYNNGITILVNNYEILEHETKIKINGISIVNGAQTTGAIGHLSSRPSDVTKIHARFIKSSNLQIIKDIVLYNNSQNVVFYSDFRSNDEYQERLRTEFLGLPNFLYNGARRGGAAERIQTHPNLLAADTIVQLLYSFHFDPIIGYNQRGEIWEKDDHYKKIFTANTHAEHLIFLYTLHKTLIEKRKFYRQNEESGRQLIDSDIQIYKFLRMRGGIHLFIKALAASMEIIVGRPIPDKFNLRFTENQDISDCLSKWKPIIDFILPFTVLLYPAVEQGLRYKEKNNIAIDNFKTHLSSALTTSYGRPVCDEFKERITFLLY